MNALVKCMTRNQYKQGRFRTVEMTHKHDSQITKLYLKDNYDIISCNQTSVVLPETNARNKFVHILVK